MKQLPSPFLFLSLAVVCSLSAAKLVATDSQRLTSQPSPLPLQGLVDAARHAGDVPALGGVIVRCEGELAFAVSGVTRLGGTEKVDANARFNIGSNAKSMLASLAATFVQNGRLAWTSTVADVIGPLMPNLEPTLGRATLSQLLSHRSGLPGYDTGRQLDSVDVDGATPSAQRLSFARHVLSHSPAYSPDTKFLYSNAGYVVAGVMLEHIGGAPFEQLMQERLFRPLGMTATFGSPVPPPAGQLWGHFTRDGVQQTYKDVAPAIPAFLQPAGDVSVTMADYGRYLREQLCGLEGRPTRLWTAATVQTMHAPHGGDSAGMGWGRYELSGRPASVHVGGTGIFSAFVAVIPGRDLAVATMINTGSEKGRAAALELLRVLAARTSVDSLQE